MPDVRRGFGASLLWLALACGGAPDSGPVEVSWDRDVCEHCAMVLGDRHSAAQVRLAGARRVQLFDDPGCALLWLGEQPDDAGAGAEIWVRDAAGREWIDARQARFVAGAITPMGYGFATAGPDASETLGLAELRQRLEAGRRR